MLFYIYSDAPGSTIDITSRCRVGRFSVKDNAEEGSVALSSLIIDDPDGDLEITGHRRIYIYESEAPIYDQVVFNGFVVNERVSRGPYRTGAGRIWTVDLADCNVLINRRIMNGADANRPAETDLARIQALLTMTELNTVDDDTYVNITAATTAMDAVDYRGQNVGAYIDDCRQASGKNAYILYNETVGQYGLWYDFDSSTVYDSGRFLTNTADEADHETVFLYSQERTYLNRDPSRVASGIYLEYDGGTVYVQDAGTIAEFAAIDWAAPSLNVKTSAKATARANRYLADAASEDEIIHTVMTKAARADVNKVKKGQLVQFKALWAPGYESYRTCRVLYRTVTEISEDPEASFEIEMDLTPQPQTETPSLVLYRPQTRGGSICGQGYVDIGWLCSGDPQPCSITTYGVDPTVGPLYPTPETFACVALGVCQYRGVTFTGTGTINYESEYRVFGAAAGITGTVDLLINGIVVASGSGVSPGYTITLNGSLAIVAGDVLTARFSHDNDGHSTPPHWCFYIDGLSGGIAQEFRITGGALTP